MNDLKEDYTMTETNVKEMKGEKIKKLFTKETLVLCGCVMTSLILGYKIGKKVDSHELHVALSKCFEFDPTLKEHFTNTVSEQMKQRLLNS